MRITVSCDRAINFAFILGDSNLAEYEGDGDGYFNHNNPPVYHLAQSVTSYAYTYTASGNGNAYWAIEGLSSFSTSCQQTVNITYTTYNVAALSRTCTGACHVSASDGSWVILQPPNRPDSRNVYYGPDDFTVGADLYTVRFLQDLKPAAKPGTDRVSACVRVCALPSAVRC
jgi:hypothetical protein